MKKAVWKQLELDLDSCAPCCSAGRGGSAATRSTRCRREILRSSGRFHDLSKIFDELNRVYFGGSVEADVTWGRASKKRRRSIQLGVFDRSAGIIRIHPLLDRRDVPEEVVELVLYHEMLHAYLGEEMVNGRRVVHGKAFKQAERAHPSYAAYVKWEKANLASLLKANT